MRPYITVTLVFILAACGSGASTQPPVLGDTVVDSGSVADAAGPDALARARDSGTGDPSLGDGSQQSLDGSTPEADPPADAAADTAVVADASPEADPTDAAMDTMDSAMEAATDAAPEASSCIASWNGSPFTLPTAAEACTSDAQCCSGVCGNYGGFYCMTACEHNAQCAYNNCRFVLTESSSAAACYGNAPGTQN